MLLTGSIMHMCHFDFVQSSTLKIPTLFFFFCEIGVGHDSILHSLLNVINYIRFVLLC